MIYNPNSDQIDKLPIGVRKSPDEVSDRNRQGFEGERGEEYKRKTQRYRAAAQGIIKSFDDPEKQKKLKKALSEGKAISNDTNEMSTNDIGYLIAVSLIFDGLAFLVCLLDFLIPLLGTVLERLTIFPAATLTLYIMSRNRGVNFSSKIIVRFWGSKIIGFIPYISLLPEYTLGTVLVVLSVKAEEKTGLKKIIDSHPEVVKYLKRYLS